MATRKAGEGPVVRRIPAEIHLQASELGLIVEVYTEVMAGHGPTGYVAWAVSSLTVHQNFTDAVSVRSGTEKTSERAWLEIRHVLAELKRFPGGDS